MKTLKTLKLNQLSKSELEKKELNYLSGGLSCGCSCSGDPTNTDLSKTVGWTWEEKCIGQCACVCGGNESQDTTDSRWLNILSSY